MGIIHNYPTALHLNTPVMAQFSSEESSSKSEKGGESLISNDQEQTETPLIALSPMEELPNPMPASQDPTTAVDQSESTTIVDQLGEWCGHAARFASKIERAYVRPCVALSLEALGASPPLIQYLETPMTLSLLLTTLYFVSAILASSLKEVAILGVVIFVHSLQRGACFTFHLLKESIFSLLIFISLSISTVIGKAFLGFPFPRSTHSTTPVAALVSERQSSSAAPEPRKTRENVGGISGLNLQQATQYLQSLKRDFKTVVQPVVAQLKALNINWKRTMKIALRTVLVLSFFVFRWKTKLLVTLLGATFGIFKTVGCCRRRRIRVFRERSGRDD